VRKSYKREAILGNSTESSYYEFFAYPPPRREIYVEDKPLKDMAIAQLTSRIDNVKVYAAGATITRVADLQLDVGEVPEHVELAGLPLALDDSSVRVRVEVEPGTSTAICLQQRFAIALIDNEIAVLHQLQVPKRPEGENGKAPPPSPMGARLALAHFKDEQVRFRIQERRHTKEKLRQAQDNLNDLLQKQARASSAREVRPHELRKTAIVRLSYEGESSTLTGQRLIVEYEEDVLSDRLAYSLMRMGAADDKSQRGKLSIEQRQDVYLEILQRRDVVVRFNVMEVVQQSITTAQNCIYVKLPPGGIQVRTVAGSFDYAYNADGRVDVPSDGEFHSVALTSKSTEVDVRYVVVPREDTNVFRIAQLKNPLQAPLLAGPADIYVDGEYILSTNITTVPPKGTRTTHSGRLSLAGERAGR
jgi:hypothetical protein